MRWSAVKEKNYQASKYQEWRRWFAWYPVKVGPRFREQVVWLEVVERKWSGAMGKDWCEYREVNP